jgi:hypothetical protein
MTQSPTDVIADFLQNTAPDRVETACLRHRPVLPFERGTGDPNATRRVDTFKV